MTELVVVSKPRTRIFKWIGGGVYKQYSTPLSYRVVSWHQKNLTGASYNTVRLAGGSYENYRSQQFITPNYTVSTVKIVLHMQVESGSSPPQGVTYIYICPDNGSNLPNVNNILGSAAINPGDVGTSETQITRTFNVTLSPNTKYWVVVYKPTYESGRFYSMYLSTADYDTSLYSAYQYSGSWTQQVYDYKMRIYCFGVFAANFDFIYNGPIIKRLQVSASTSNTTINNYVLNGQTYTSITRETDIPQSNNYTLTVNYTENAAASSGYVDLTIQRWLYYSSTSCTLEQLNVSEAYVQEILFGSTGGVLRIDDDPSADLIGQANEKIVFTNIIVPFRKLEWISGSGEVMILGVE